MTSCVTPVGQAQRSLQRRGTSLRRRRRRTPPCPSPAAPYTSAKEESPIEEVFTDQWSQPTDPEEKKEEEGGADPFANFVDIEPPRKKAKTEATPTLLNLPIGLAGVRQAVFELNSVITWTPDEYEAYWPYCDNFWVRNTTAKRITKKGRESEIWYCRLNSDDYEPKGNGYRNKAHRDVCTCVMRLKMVKTWDLQQAPPTLKSVQLSNHKARGKEVVKAHNHELGYVDQIKKNSKLMQVVGDEMGKGYEAANINDLIAGTKYEANRSALLEAGGQHLSRKDIHNAGRGWKKRNPDIRTKGAREEWQVQTDACEAWLQTQEGMLTKLIKAVRTLDSKLAHGICWAKICECWPQK